MQRRHLMSALALAPLAAMSGCGALADPEHLGEDAPRPQPLRSPVRTAWVLSSGGPRGFAHVGVLKALAELGLKPDLIVGASIGAMVGTLCASGMPAARMEALAMEFSAFTVMRPNLGTGTEKLSAAGMISLVNRQLDERPLEQLELPVAVVALERDSRQLVAFTRGNAGVAIQASCAIEGQLAPVRILGRTYVDPDLVAPMPVRLARSLGAWRVLAVDVSAHEHKAPAGSERYRAGDLRKRALTQPDALSATLTLHPEFSYYVSLSQAFREQAIRAGYEHTMARADELRRVFGPA